MARFGSGIGIRLALVGAIALGGWLLRDRLTGNAGELQVGDCFDDPAATQDIEDVQHHPCSEAHTAEVFYVADMPGGGGAALPTEADLVAFASGSCVPAFAAYTGFSIDSNFELDFSMFYPSDEGWADGDREATCYIVRVDGGPMQGSLRAAAP